MISPSQAVSSIGASETVKLSEMVAALKAKGKDVLSLTMGEPDFPTPKNIVDAAKKALDDGHTHYTSSYGIEPLRQAVAEKCQKDNGLDCKWQDVLITPTKFARGDEVLIPDPAWVSYNALVHLSGGKIVSVPAGEDVNFEMDPDKVNEKVSKKTKIMILNSPSNPTGGVASLKRLKGRGLRSHRSGQRGRQDHHGERLFQGLRHDRLEGGILGSTQASARPGHEDPAALPDLRDLVRPVRRTRSPQGPTGAHPTDGR